MRNQALKLAVLVVLFATVLSSCKKGEDDPFLSFRSRDARVIGSWELKSADMTSKTQTTDIVSNNVNTDEITEVFVYQEEEKIEGSTKTIRTFNSTTTNQKNTWFDSTENEFVSEATEVMSSTERIDEYNFSVKVEIQKDFSYSYTYSESLVKRTINSFDGENTTTTITEYEYPEINTVSDEGNWVWLDSKKNKVVIQAGYMSGSILRLANDEVIIEDADTASDTSVENEQNYFSTYDDIEKPGNVEYGLRTRTLNTNSYFRRYMEWVSI